MSSVTLDEAIGLRRAGRLQMAYQLLAVTPALCSKLTCPLMSLLRAMTLHDRHFGTTPASLPDNFQRSKSQRVARFNGVFSHVLLTRRSQFLHKISTQLELTEELGESFLTSVKELDASHYDLNTCLRESVVLLKCFLLALPDKQLAEFQATLRQEDQISRSTSRVPSLTRNLAHRRLTPVKGQ